MAKLTLSFRDRKLKVFALQSGDCLIGREPDCTIQIDSLAIEPQHACIRSSGAGYSIEPATDNAGITINDKPITETHELQEGDQIQIGKHTLAFSAESESTVPESNVERLPNVGWLQIQNGAHLGRTIRLDKAFTRVGKPDGHLAIIAHRDDGYYISHLKGEYAPLVNEQAIGDTAHKLNNTDHIAVGTLAIQFFDDASAAQDSEVPVVEQEEKNQRQFSRIPFDVTATLQKDQQSWETDLLDISLHGALIRKPDSFDCEGDQTFQLAVHLEGGPDIRMDVVVAHQEDEELGLRCRDIDVDSITHLRRLVELNLGDSELLERELSALG
jgi:pSer/pThr/pTyr-binding forkhead associated (FHA) protein